MKLEERYDGATSQGLRQPTVTRDVPGEGLRKRRIVHCRVLSEVMWQILAHRGLGLEYYSDGTAVHV